ncbi:MAG: response regulator transcription factor [Pseudomonadota bacterium]
MRTRYDDAMTLDTPSPRTFLVIDDHPLFCDALSMTLRSFRDDTQVATANSLEQGLSVIDEGISPDIVLLDLNLPDVDGVDGLLRLRRRLNDTPIVVLSSYDDDAVVTRVLKAGAVGFVSKKSGGSELEAALRKIWDGETCVPKGYRPVANGHASEAPSEDGVAKMDLLTPQQRRILMLVSEGRLNKQIAGDLSIAETTVKAHITVILRKLGVQSRTQAALIAQKAQMGSLLR